jgi:hypothetical protein
MEGTENKTYRSPLRKLVRCFERSRNGWKQKCREAKALAKRRGNRVRKLKVSRDRWKEVAAQQAEELSRLRDELEALKNS